MTVLLAYLPTSEGCAALDAAIAEASWRHCRLVVVNVGLGTRPSEAVFANQSDLDAVRERLIDSGVQHDIKQFTAASEVSTSILAEAHSVGAELIVVGLHHRSPLRTMLLGSTAQHLIFAADCPVLSVRARPGVPRTDRFEESVGPESGGSGEGPR